MTVVVILTLLAGSFVGLFLAIYVAECRFRVKLDRIGREARASTSLFGPDGSAWFSALWRDIGPDLDVEWTLEP